VFLFPFNDEGFDGMRAWIAENQATFNGLMYEAQQKARILGGAAWAFHVDYWDAVEGQDESFEVQLAAANDDFSPEGFERYQAVLFSIAGFNQAMVNRELKQLAAMERGQV
jgi:hypothetical protein